MNMNIQDVELDVLLEKLRAREAEQSTAAARAAAAERDAAALRHAQEIQSKRAELADETAAGDAALLAAETAMREAAKQLKLVLTHRSAARKVQGWLNQNAGDAAVTLMGDIDLLNDLSRKVAAQLFTV